MSRHKLTSHLIPRTRDGRIATALFVVLFLLAMPPVTHVVLDRPDVWIAGVPFLYVALLVVYIGLIGVLVWALRRGV
jgi:hypothetical protein